MQITNQNELPQISINIGSNEDDAIILCLYDTDLALTSGEITHHQHIIKVYLNIVEIYENLN